MKNIITESAKFNLTDKRIVFVNDELDIELNLILGNLPYLKPKNEYDIPRPTSLTFAINNEIFHTHELSNYALTKIFDKMLEMSNTQPLNKSMKYIDELMKLTLGDMLALLIDEIEYRHFNMIVM